MCDLMHEWHSVWPTTMTIETGGNRCRSSQIDDSMGNYLSAGDKTLQRRRRLSTKSNGIRQLGDEYSHFAVEHIVSISQKCIDFQ